MSQVFRRAFYINTKIHAWQYFLIRGSICPCWLLLTCSSTKESSNCKTSLSSYMIRTKERKGKEGVRGLNTRRGNCRRTLSRATLRTLTMCKQNMATLHSLKSSQNMKIEIVSIINQFTLNKLPSHGTMDDKDINVEVPDLRIGRMKHSLNFSDDFWGPPSSQQVHFPLTAAQPQVRVFSQVYWECSPWALFLQQPLK